MLGRERAVSVLQRMACYKTCLPCNNTQRGRIRRLLEIARHKLLRIAMRVGIKFKQPYAQEGKTLRRRAGGHTMQFKRLRAVLKRQRTILG